MTDEEYVFHETSRERKRNARGDYNKKRQGGKHVRLSTDSMTRKEWEKMNGEVITFELDQPRSWEEYKEIPDDLKFEYLEYLWAKYEATPSMLGMMFNVNRRTVYEEQKRLGLVCPTTRGKPKASVIKKWGEFLNVEKPEQKPDVRPSEKQIQQTVTTLRDMLEQLVGKGARVTIELTL